MRRHRRCMGVVAWCVASGPLGLAQERELEPPSLEGLSDEELRGRLESVSHEDARFRDEQRLLFESCLLEMVRRGGAAWERFLHEQLRAAASLPEFDRKELEVLTALRRVQKRSDPITVDVDGPLRAEAEFPDLPVFDVALRNVDVEGRPVVIQLGGDYRGGRPGRFRFEVRDAEGDPVPIKQTWGMMGGISGFGALEPGEAWVTTLDMQQFIELGQPGEFTVTIQYHDSAYLSNIENPAGLLVCRSKPIELVLRPRTIQLGNEREAELRRLVGAFNGLAPLRIIDGHYTPEHADFIAPDSAPGRILNSGWQAVPVLIEALEDPDLAPSKRGWVLGMLFMITGRHSPLYENGVLQSHTHRSGSWQVWGGKGGEPQSGGIGFGGRGYSTGSVDVPAQKAFAAYWSSWKEWLHLVRTP